MKNIRSFAALRMTNCGDFCSFYPLARKQVKITVPYGCAKHAPASTSAYLKPGRIAGLVWMNVFRKAKLLDDYALDLIYELFGIVTVHFDLDGL